MVQGKDLDPAAIEVTLTVRLIAMPQSHAVISCLHANLAALEAVLADIDLQGIATITCLGDLVGYGPQPNEVVDLVRQRSIPTCQGCWDEDIIEGLNACDCSYPSQLAERRGHLAHQWTAEQLSEESKAFLASLPMSLRRDRLLFVHGSPNSQHEYLLPDMDAFAALERVESAGAETLFCGHTHRPYVRELREGSIRVQRHACCHGLGELLGLPFATSWPMARPWLQRVVRGRFGCWLARILILIPASFSANLRHWPSCAPWNPVAGWSVLPTPVPALW